MRFLLSYILLTSITCNTYKFSPLDTFLSYICMAGFFSNRCLVVYRGISLFRITLPPDKSAFRVNGRHAVSYLIQHYSVHLSLYAQGIIIQLGADNRGFCITTMRWEQYPHKLGHTGKVRHILIRDINYIIRVIRQPEFKQLNQSPVEIMQHF